MGKFKAFLVFAYLIGFLIMWEVSASPDFEDLIGERIQKSECQDVFSRFPKYSGDMLGYVAQLEAVLRNSDNKIDKKLAIESLGKIGVVQTDSSSRLCLPNIFNFRFHSQV